MSEQLSGGGALLIMSYVLKHATFTFHFHTTVWNQLWTGVCICISRSGEDENKNEKRVWKLEPASSHLIPE